MSLSGVGMRRLMAVAHTMFVLDTEPRISKNTVWQMPNSKRSDPSELQTPTSRGHKSFLALCNSVMWTIGLVGWHSPADVIGFSCLSHKGYEQVRERIPKIHGLILFWELSELRMGRELEAPATIGSNGLNFFRATHLFAIRGQFPLKWLTLRV
ncbi:MAG: hypothetical protein ABQ298_01260 [Puniceicoccaceae bacterium]